MHAIRLITLLSLASLVSSAIARDASFSTNDSASPYQSSVAVTIYNSNLALIKDSRKVSINKGVSDLELKDVSAQIRPETVLLRSLSNPGSFSILEQNFDFDLLTPQKLLEKYAGKQVIVVKTNPQTGAETSEPATVLSANNGAVLKVGNRIETGIPGRIVYEGVPDNLRDRPTLVSKVDNKGPQSQEVELSYLSGGLGWKADYVAELNPKENSIDLSGWVTLTNTSGASYKNAKLQLVAGDVNVVQDISPRVARAKHSDMAMESMAAAPMSQESLMEYHLYTVSRPTTIADNQTKQVALLSATGVPARKELVLSGADYYYTQQMGDIGTKLKVGVFVEFDNKDASKLGIPLPKGIMRMYKKDSLGNAQFVGEDSIDHTPKNEKVRLKLGDSFDATADKKQTEFKVLPNPQKGHSSFESSFEFTLKNSKKDPITVVVQEPIGGDWKIVKESHRHLKANSHLAVWSIAVPAESSATLKYTVQTKF